MQKQNNTLDRTNNKIRLYDTYGYTVCHKAICLCVGKYVYRIHFRRACLSYSVLHILDFICKGYDIFQGDVFGCIAYGDIFGDRYFSYAHSADCVRPYFRRVPHLCHPVQPQMTVLYKIFCLRFFRRQFFYCDINFTLHRVWVVL